MTPALDILAGMLGGMIMGMTFAGHSAVLFTFNPPRVLLKRIERGRAVNLVVAIAGGALSLWTMIGVILALIADALMEGDKGFSLVPNVTYLGLVMAGIIAAGLPVLFAMRDKWQHVAFWALLAVVIYGLLMPNLVIALQNRI